MKLNFSILALLSISSGYATSLSGTTWPDQWNEFNPPSSLEEVRPGEAVGYGDHQKWIYMTSPSSGRYVPTDNNYTGDTFILMNLSKDSIQNVTYGASPIFNGNTNIYLQSGTFSAVYGGGRAGDGVDSLINGSTNVTIGGTAKISDSTTNSKAVYGGSYAGADRTAIVKGGSNIYITDAAEFDKNYTSFVAGGGYTNGKNGYTLVEGGSHIRIDGGVVNSTLYLHGGGWAYERGTSQVTGGTHIELAQGGCAEIISGGGRTSGTPNQGVSIVDKTHINVTGGEVNDVVGGGVSNWFGLTQVTDGVEINVSGGTINNDLVGGGRVDGDSTALLKGHTQVQGGVSIKISGSANVNDVYGGGILFDKGVASTVEGGSVIDMTGGSVNNIHGGGSLSALAGTKSTQDYHLLVSVDQATVNVSGGTVAGNVFGGGESVIDTTNYTVNSTALNQVGSTHVHISNGKLGTADNGSWSEGQIYGGGDGTNANITGDTNVIISGGEMGNVSGGGLGDNTIEGNANVVISGGTIHGSVYAGSVRESSVIKGDAHLKLDGTNWTVDGNFYGGYAEGSATLELSGIKAPFSSKVSTERISGFDRMNLTNGSIQDIGDLAAYGMKVNVDSGSILSRKDSSSFTVDANLSQGGYFDANGAELASVTLGSGSYSWLTSNGGAIINFSHTDAPINVDTNLAVKEGDSLTVSGIEEGKSVIAAGGKVDVSQVASEKGIVLGSFNDSTGKASSAQVLMDSQQFGHIVSNKLIVESNKMTVVNKQSVIESAQLTMSDKTSVLENNGDLSKVEKFIVTDGTLKGSGLFGTVVMEGGILIVGNSPGSQTFSSLELGSSSTTIFSINGLTSNDGITTGWESNTFSNINAGQQLTLVAGTTFTLEFGQGFLKSLEEGKEYSFDLVFYETLNGNISDINLTYSSYNEASGTAHSMEAPFTDARLEVTDQGIRFVGVAKSASIPEPSSAILGLTGMLFLSWRRRRIHA